MDTVGTSNEQRYRQQERLARITGALFVVIAVLGMVGPGIIQSLVVEGDPGATADKVRGALPLVSGGLALWVVLLAADTAAAFTIHGIFEPTNRVFSFIAAAFRLVYVAIAGAALSGLYDAVLMVTSPQRAGTDLAQRQIATLASLDAFNSGFVVALAFFGIHVAALGVLLYRTRYVPRVLGGVVVIAGASYLVHSVASFFIADQTGLAGPIVLAPAALGEIGLTIWLLVKGVNVRPGIDVATAQSGSAQHHAPELAGSAR